MIKAFKERVQADNNLSTELFDVIWIEAFDRASSDGLSGVYYEFKNLMAFAENVLKTK